MRAIEVHTVAAFWGHLQGTFITYVRCQRRWEVLCRCGTKCVVQGHNFFSGLVSFVVCLWSAIEGIHPRSWWSTWMHDDRCGNGRCRDDRYRCTMIHVVMVDVRCHNIDLSIAMIFQSMIRALIVVMLKSQSMLLIRTLMWCRIYIKFHKIIIRGYLSNQRSRDVSTWLDVAFFLSTCIRTVSEISFLEYS